jgi:hypothetical protein
MSSGYSGHAHVRGLYFLDDSALLDGVVLDHRARAAAVRSGHHYARTHSGSYDGRDTALQQAQRG